uniref:Reverse transcriptase domain-containing protein n=1 Tax=Cannabis sativa TaxID=3483 RepID=A0A803QJ80_CANSA
MASSSHNIEDLERQYADIQLEEEDEGGINYEGEDRDDEDTFDARWALVGRFITDQTIDFDAMQNKLAALWRPKRGLYVKLLDSNRFLFQFFHEIDIVRVIEGSPWTFNRVVLIFQRLKEGDSPREIVLKELDIWVQLHDVKSGFRTDRLVRDASNYVGSFIEADKKNFKGNWRGYLKARVTIDVEKPLKRRMKVRTVGKEWFWVNFKYERVPLFCFICGIIGHSERFCEELFVKPIADIVKPYGEWMRANPIKSNHYSIGAKWLRPGGAGSPEVENGDTVDQNEDDVMADLNEIAVIGNQGKVYGGIGGSNRGIDFNSATNRDPNLNTAGGFKDGSQLHKPTIGEGERVDAHHEEVLFMDTKRRRPNGEIDNAEINVTMGQVKQGPPKNLQSVGLDFILDLIIQKKPNIVFLCEVLCKRDRVERLKRQCHFDGCFVVESQGRGGGIAMLWKDNEEVSLVDFSNNHINVTVKLERGGAWLFTGLYGEPNRNLRHKTWSQICDLAASIEGPWCIMGDVNNVCNVKDKRGGRPYPASLIQGFNDALSVGRLQDLCLEGYPFTWERGRGTDKWVEVRIDRALVNQEWLSCFSMAKLFNLEVSTSDHCPIILMLNPDAPSPSKRKFRFENAWLKDPMCLQIIQDCWESQGGLELKDKLSFCGEKLAEWGNDILGNLKNQIAKCKKDIKQLKNKRDDVSCQAYKEANDQLSKLLGMKESYWRQRSKQLWLKEGDQNTKYFHASASARRRNNLITSLCNNDGERVDWDSGLSEVIADYFHDLFSSSDVDLESVVDGVRSSVSTEQNNELLLPVSPEEIRSALFQMHPDKAAGPDGFNPGFYQKSWHIVGHDIVMEVQKFFATGTLASGINDTNLVLIPKKKSPSSLRDLRPIALCNVVYKIVTKVIANRLKHMLNSLISETQSAFVPGRLISDNILVSFEVMHYLKRKRKGKVGFMAIKLDMSKAYDRVEWPFLMAIMLRMGFDSREIRYHPTYSLFVLKVSLLSFVIEFQGSAFMGVRWLGCPSISHMFFADDSYLFCKANEREAGSIMELLSIFEAASGQQVNYDKSFIFFSANTNAEARNTICDFMGINEAGLDSHYLGLPNTMGRNKKALLGFLKEKIRKRIQSWDGRLLSRAGKEILIKTVVQALPTYAMSVFLIPLDICKDIERMMSMFWWNSKSSKKRGISWMAWDRMARSKFGGGMGFRRLHEFNIAMLGKQGWKFLQEDHSLVFRVFKARYFPNDTFMTATLGNNPSFVWRSILEAQNLLKTGCCWSIGSGSLVKVVSQPWLPDRANPYITSRHPGLADATVDQLMVPGEQVWDKEILEDMFEPRDINLILSIPLSDRSFPDRWYWAPESTGRYSVKSAYTLQLELAGLNLEDSNSGFWRKLWNLKIPPKCKNLLWRALVNCLPTNTMLATKRVHIDTTCPLCRNAPETVVHVFVDCAFAKNCWSFLNEGHIPGANGDFLKWMIDIFDNFSNRVIRIVSIICWQIWKVRNELVWNKATPAAFNVVIAAVNLFDLWNSAHTDNHSDTLNADGANRVSEHWTKPMQNRIKINTDAAIFDSTSEFGFSFVARDSAGALVEAHVCCVNGLVRAELAEAIGVKEALSWLKKHPQIQADVETDCVNVVKAIHSSVEMFSAYGNVIHDCRHLLASLRNVSICYVKRSANVVAHWLARASCYLPDRIIREDNCPSDLLPLLAADCCF